MKDFTIPEPPVAQNVGEANLKVAESMEFQGPTPDRDVPRSSYDPGPSNEDLEKAANNYRKSRLWDDLSLVTLCLFRHRRDVDLQWMMTKDHLAYPHNIGTRHFLTCTGMEVAEGYSQAIADIAADPVYGKCKYLLTYESDNLPPADGLLLLYQSINGEIDGQRYDAVGGLYWTKSEAHSTPLIFGDPKEPDSFRQLVPQPGKIVECNGIPMGFTLHRMEMFRDEALPRPLFQNRIESTDGHQISVSQDLFFWQNARKLGYRCAIDCRVLVGHLRSDGRVF